jgi:hypothetical protein
MRHENLATATEHCMLGAENTWRFNSKRLQYRLALPRNPKTADGFTTTLGRHQPTNFHQTNVPVLNLVFAIDNAVNFGNNRQVSKRKHLQARRKTYKI